MKFRHWCQEKWYQHCEEVLSWSGHNVGYLSQEYFNEYRWWLRREYRSAMNQK